MYAVQIASSNALVKKREAASNLSSDKKISSADIRPTMHSRISGRDADVDADAADKRLGKGPRG